MAVWDFLYNFAPDMIDRATIDKIMDATNIVDVVGEFVTLRKAGVNYKGLCSFLRPYLNIFF